jgi:hypothetical protein
LEACNVCAKCEIAVADLHGRGGAGGIPSWVVPLYKSPAVDWAACIYRAGI